MSHGTTNQPFEGSTWETGFQDALVYRAWSLVEVKSSQQISRTWVHFVLGVFDSAFSHISQLMRESRRVANTRPGVCIGISASGASS